MAEFGREIEGFPENVCGMTTVRGIVFIGSVRPSGNPSHDQKSAAADTFQHTGDQRIPL